MKTTTCDVHTWNCGTLSFIFTHPPEEKKILRSKKIKMCTCNRTYKCFSSQYLTRIIPRIKRIRVGTLYFEDICMYNCDFFVCFRTYLFVRALLAKILKLRRYRKPVRNLWSRFELDPSAVARVAGAQSFFFSGSG